MDINHILDQFKHGECTKDEVVRLLKNLPYEDIASHTKLDHHRKLRTGFGEVVYCPGKTCEQLVDIFHAFEQAGSTAFGTRASVEQYQAIAQAIPSMVYDPISRTLTLPSPKGTPPTEPIGLVAICTGGTSDIPVAEEAAETAAFLGSRVMRFYDIGVAGIHRLFDHIDAIRQANAIVVVAGMEGALGSVVAGLVEAPVIAVPTSVGYGASFEGIAPLLTMLNSCAEGLAVVNIDNGFGAGYMAAQINRQSKPRI